MKRTIAFSLTAALLAGCVDAPSTTPSQTPLKSETLGLNGAATSQIADRWWTAFGDPQLDSLVDQALAGSPTLQAALARVREAQSELSGTRALTYPQLTLDANETRERFSKDYIIPPPPFGPGGSTKWIGTVQSNLSWSLDLFGKQSAQVDRARSTAQAAELDATAAQLLLAGNVTQAYVALWGAYALTDVAQEAVNERSGVLHLTAGRVKAGLDSGASTKQAEALLATAREDLIAANAECDMTVHAIAALIGRGADAYNITRPQLNDAALALPANLPADLLARRADIAAAEARIDAATSGREAARKEYYPDINLVGLAGFAAIGLGPLFSSAAMQYGAGSAIHLPIFDAGKINADYAGATATLDQAVADYNQSVVTAVKQTADAMTNLKSIEDQAQQQRDALAASQASFDLAMRRYRSGLSPQTNVLDSEALLIQSRRQQAVLVAGRAAARVQLLMAIGGGFDPARNNSTDTVNQDKTP